MLATIILIYYFVIFIILLKEIHVDYAHYAKLILKMVGRFTFI